MKETADQLVAYCQEIGRVCPLPDKWNQLWEMLPERKRLGAVWEPPLPLILAAWHHTSDSEKMMRLAEHIHWADKYDALEQASVFLCGLPESEWHHLGD